MKRAIWNGSVKVTLLDHRSPGDITLITRIGEWPLLGCHLPTCSTQIVPNLTVYAIDCAILITYSLHCIIVIQTCASSSVFLGPFSMASSQLTDFKTFTFTFLSFFSKSASRKIHRSPVWVYWNDTVSLSMLHNRMHKKSEWAFGINRKYWLFQSFPIKDCAHHERLMGPFFHLHVCLYFLSSQIVSLQHWALVSGH